MSAADELKAGSTPWEPPRAEVQINTDLCRNLRAMLAQAERGEIIFGVFIGVGPNGQVVECIAMANGPMEYITATALDVAKAKIISNVIRQQQDQRASPIIKPNGRDR